MWSPSKGGLAADSTGFSTKRYETWFTIRKGRGKRRAYIKPKKNSKVKARGSQAWRSMFKLYREDREEFDKHYHKRDSRMESVYLVLKRVFGNNLSSRKRRSERNELCLRSINYNIGITNITSRKEMVRQLFCHSL